MNVKNEEGKDFSSEGIVELLSGALKSATVWAAFKEKEKMKENL